MEETADPRRQRVEAMRVCLENLPHESRTLLRMRYDEGRTGAELARLLGNTKRKNFDRKGDGKLSPEGFGTKSTE